MPQRLFHVLARLTAARLLAAPLAFAAIASTVQAAPLIETGEVVAPLDKPTPTLAQLTAADDNFLVWNDASPAVSRPERVAEADTAPVVGSVEALNAAFDGENPIIPVPPGLVVGIVGLISVGGLAIRRQQGSTSSAKLF